LPARGSSPSRLHPGGGLASQLDWASGQLDAGSTDETTVLMLADAQTSGGLLFGADPDAAEQAVADLRASGQEAALVGRLGQGTGRLHLR
jgi:selenide,water dikinase